MKAVSVRELRNYGGQVLDAVEKGESMTITRDGRPVAHLSPVPKANISAGALLQAFKNTPRIDGELLRSELSEILDLEID